MLGFENGLYRKSNTVQNELIATKHVVTDESVFLAQKEGARSIPSSNKPSSLEGEDETSSLTIDMADPLTIGRTKLD